MILERRAEVLKLARLLGVEPESLVYLEKVPADELRRLRGMTADAVYGPSGDVLQRVAAANRLLPVKILASIAERALGPVITAQLASMIDAGRAVDIAERLPTEFLADVSVAMDPRRASDVIGRMPADRIADVTEVLLARDEYVAMGMFVGHLSDEALSASLDLIDPSELLKIAFVLEEKDRIDRVIGMLEEERLAGIVAAAAADELWEEAADLVRNVGDPHRWRLLELAADYPELDKRVEAALKPRAAATARRPATRRRSA